MSKDVIYAVRRMNDDDGFEIHAHNLWHITPTRGRLTIRDETIPVRQRFRRATKIACLKSIDSGSPIEGFELHDIVVAEGDCGRLIIYGKQRSEIGSRIKVTGQAWWCEVDGFIDTGD